MWQRPKPKPKPKARRGRRVPHQPGAAFRSDLGMVEEAATEDERETEGEETEAETEEEERGPSHGRSNTSSMHDGRDRRWVVPRAKPPLATNAAGEAQALRGPLVPRAKPPLNATGRSGERESEREATAFNKRFVWNRNVNEELEQRRVERPPSIFVWRSPQHAGSGTKVSPRNAPLPEPQHDAETHYVEEEEEEGQWHAAGEVPENNHAHTPLNTTPPFTPRTDDETSEEEFDEESDEESDEEALEAPTAEFWSQRKAEAEAMERIARRRTEMRRASLSSHSDNSGAADGGGGGALRTDEQSEQRGGSANMEEAAGAQTTKAAAALSPDDVPITVSDEPTSPKLSSPEELNRQRERGLALRTMLDRLGGTAKELLQSTQPPTELNRALQEPARRPALPPLPPLPQPLQQSAAAPRPQHRTSLDHDDGPVSAQSTSVEESAGASAAPPQTPRSFLLRNMPPVVDTPPPTAPSSSNKVVANRLAPGRPFAPTTPQNSAPKVASRSTTLPSPRPTLVSPRPGGKAPRQASADRLAALATPRVRTPAKAKAAEEEEAGAFSPRTASSARDAAKPGWNTSIRPNAKPPPSRHLMGKR